LKGKKKEKKRKKKGNRAYEDSLTHMAQDLPVGMGMNLARTELIRNANKDFLIKLGNRTMEDMTYQGR